MLSSIHPLGERARSNRWSVTVGAHVVGALAGGAALGALAGSVGWVLHHIGLGMTAIAALAAAAALLALAVDGHVLNVRIPGPRRQVHEVWLTAYRGWVYGAGFGAQLGVGIATIITTAAVWLVVVLALLAGSPLAGALVAGAFGLARGTTLLAGAGITDAERLRSFHRRLQAGAPIGRQLVLLGEAGVVATAVWVLIA